MTIEADALVDAIDASARRLRGDPDDYAPLIARIGNARFVLIGEASHGTHDFYAERARISQTLIERQGFNGVAVEADWPDAYRFNRYVRATSNEANGRDALRGFARFPSWMWRNTDVLSFVEWLRGHNDSVRDPARKVGFYGLDLYSLYASIDAVIRYLDGIDPHAARQARNYYACFDRFDRDSERYAYATGFGASASCEDAAVAQLAEMQRVAAATLRDTDDPSSDEGFYAVQNARVVKNAEEYYRKMFRGRVSTWNLRDRHMADTLAALDAYLSRATPARIVVWAHNSHVGDARATELGSIGEWTLGQLVREQCDVDAVLIGFTTDRGTVIAASDWGGRAERKRVRPALRSSYEALFHRTDVGRFLIVLRDDALARALEGPRLERAIGVVYLPESERRSHYFNADLVRQFDAVIHLDETRALEPLDKVEETKDAGDIEVPEAYPSGL